MKKIVDQWMKDNPDFGTDLEELALKLTMFNAKWGTRLQPPDFIKHKQTD